MQQHLDNTVDEVDAFDQVCERLAGFDQRLQTEWIDGYLTALASGPVAVATEVWLPRLMGDAFERAFADPDDVAQALAALTARTRVLARQLDPEWLLDHPDELLLQPLMAVWDDAARAEVVANGSVSAEIAASFLTGEYWAVGFFAALEDFAQDWRDPVDGEALALKEDLLTHVDALTLPEGADLQAHLAHWYPGQTPSRDALVDEACYAIQDLRIWWLDHAPRPATRRVDAKPGRNDRCPCGSGKKYKKCHGASA